MKKAVVSGAEDDDLRLLHIDLHTLFVMSSSERIERQNDPDHSSGPRLFFAGCPRGNLARVGHEVEDRMVMRLLALTAKEPPWRDPAVLPHCLEKVIDLLSHNQPRVTVGPAVIYQLPNDLRYKHPATIVRGDSAAGRQLLTGLATRGLPQSMIEMGFKGLSDFWEPWCVALAGEEIASVAFTARLGKAGAEIGVATFPNFRGQGYAAAVTASWSSIPTLKRRALFYSTARSNRSSQRVAARLGLRMIGASVNVT